MATTKCITVLWVTAVASTACTTWAPPAFSPELSSDEPCAVFVGHAAGVTDIALQRTAMQPFDASDRLDAAVADIEQARRRYIHVARCLTQSTNMSGAALIGLSSLALFKGLTSSHPKDLAGIGVLGGATYLYGGGADAAIGQRRLVYYAGADALSCTLRAAEPYRRQPGDGGSGSLRRLERQAQDARDALSEPERKLQAEARAIRETTRRGRRADPTCSQVSVQQCDRPAPEATSLDLARIDACQAVRARCTATPDTRVRVLPHPAVTTMLDDIVKARDDIDRLLAESSVVQATVEMTASLVSGQSARIQVQVAREVDKTFPDLASVLNAAGGLKALGLRVSKASVFGDPGAGTDTQSGRTESDASTLRAENAPEAELADARQRLNAAIATAADLRHALRLVYQRVAVVNTDLRTCSMGSVGPQAPIDQGEPAQALAPPAVAGTGGTPAATLVAADLDDTAIALLGLKPGATGRQAEAAVQACQRTVLGRRSATGDIAVDGETMQAILKGKCRAVSK